MDLLLLAERVMTWILPFLPFVTKATEALVEKVGEEAGDALVTKTRAALAKDQRATQAVEKLAAAPDDDMARTLLVTRLESLLSADPELAEALRQRLVPDSAPIQVGNVTIGSGSAMAIGPGSRAAASGGKIG